MYCSGFEKRVLVELCFRSRYPAGEEGKEERDA